MGCCEEVRIYRGKTLLHPIPIAEVQIMKVWLHLQQIHKYEAFWLNSLIESLKAYTAKTVYCFRFKWIWHIPYKVKKLKTASYCTFNRKNQWVSYNLVVFLVSFTENPDDDFLTHWEAVCWLKLFRLSKLHYCNVWSTAFIKVLQICF